MANYCSFAALFTNCENIQRIMNNLFLHFWILSVYVGPIISANPDFCQKITDESPAGRDSFESPLLLGFRAGFRKGPLKMHCKNRQACTCLNIITIIRKFS